MLSASGIYKKFGKLEVLKDVNIQVGKGEVVSIVGSSGAGKSTLLHILGTLDTPDRGQIEIGGVQVHQLKGHALSDFRNKHIGFIFQFHHLLPEFSAIENVCIPGWIAGRSRNSVYKDAEQWLSRLGLSERIHNKPQELSGGEQQRVAVARALINQPSIIMADEPTGNLDSKNARELHELFIELSKSYQQTFLIVTHNEELADKSDRILHMSDGRML
jgi:lipoprotein-releasing system ATP-binding protein